MTYKIIYDLEEMYQVAMSERFAQIVKESYNIYLIEEYEKLKKRDSGYCTDFIKSLCDCCLLAKVAETKKAELFKSDDEHENIHTENVDLLSELPVKFVY